MPTSEQQRRKAANKSRDLSRNPNATKLTAPVTADKNSADRFRFGHYAEFPRFQPGQQEWITSRLPSNSGTKPVATPLPTPVASLNATSTPTTNSEIFSNTGAQQLSQLPRLLRIKPRQDRWGPHERADQLLDFVGSA